MKDLPIGPALVTLAILSSLLLGTACKPGTGDSVSESKESAPELVIKRRDDGTLSSLNQVDSLGQVHGTRVTYYADGKTVYLKKQYTHGIPDGPYAQYYRNGQAFEEGTFRQGKRDGEVRKFYQDGRLCARYQYRTDRLMPGLEEYSEAGEPIRDYPDIVFQATDLRETRSRIDLEMQCTDPRPNVRYWILDRDDFFADRVSLHSEKGRALIQFYARPGDGLDTTLHIVAEIPTILGNSYVRKLSYRLR
ncbi:MAG: hypothetical protein R2751_01980 [Bacteroidales bacterium]